VVLHLPAARVGHHVSADRMTWRYFRKRCWSEGISKAIVSGLAGSDALTSERTCVARTLPRGVLRGLRDGARGDSYGLARAGAIVAGTAITALGFARGRLARR
jgi:hypothetical protein